MAESGNNRVNEAISEKEEQQDQDQDQNQNLNQNQCRGQGQGQDQDQDQKSGGLCGGRFKLDLFSVEREEARTGFLRACSALDADRVWEHVFDNCVHPVNPAKAIDSIGQNCYHFVAVAAGARDEVRRGRLDRRQEEILNWAVQYEECDVNQRRKEDGWTPLMLAAVFNRPLMVSRLLSLGADATVVDEEGRTAEDLAVQYKMPRTRDILMKHRTRVPNSRFSVTTSEAGSSHSSSSSRNVIVEKAVPTCSPSTGAIPKGSSSSSTTAKSMSEEGPHLLAEDEIRPAPDELPAAGSPPVKQQQDTSEGSNPPLLTAQ